MENKRKALGKGLEQLFNSEPLNLDTLNNYEKEIVETANKSDILEISLEEIYEAIRQTMPRRLHEKNIAAVKAAYEEVVA